MEALFSNFLNLPRGSWALKKNVFCFLPSQLFFWRICLCAGSRSKAEALTKQHKKDFEGEPNCSQNVSAERVSHCRKLVCRVLVAFLQYLLRHRQTSMTTLRRFTCFDLLSFASINLDPLTETVCLMNADYFGLR